MERLGSTAAPAAPTSALVKQRNIVLVALLAAAGAAWVLVILGARGEMAPMAGGLGLTTGMGALAFVTMWTVMMVAMMFPASAPMILTFSALQARKRAAGRPYVPVSIFTGSYILVWAAFGILAFALATGLDQVAVRFDWLTGMWPRFVGGLLVAGGVYQLTPLKETCLTQCRTPFSFLLSHWRDGWTGAVSMGVRHGAYCVGCCWLLFVILVAIGVMNLPAMAVVTLVVFAEKTFPLGEWVARAAAVGLVAYGLVVLAFPAALPGTM